MHTHYSVCNQIYVHIIFMCRKMCRKLCKHFAWAVKLQSPKYRTQSLEILVTIAMQHVMSHEASICSVTCNMQFNSLSTRPHQSVVWYNNSWLGFFFILNHVPKERENFVQKMSPHLSQLNVAMAHRNYFRQNNLQILKLATYTTIEDHYSMCKLATF